VLAVRAIRYGGDDPVANLDIGEVPDPAEGPREVRLPLHNANLFVENSIPMQHPYRTRGTGIHNAARYHDTKGRPVFSSGRVRYGRVPYDTFPDTPPVRCQGTTRSGAPCKNWAVITKTLCRWHGGGNRRLMRPPCRARECPINFKHGGRAHR
jgi:hypothetical protein